jgi:hypothetical protein
MARVRRLHHLVGHRLGELLADVDPELRHRGHDIRVDAVGRLAARGSHMDAPVGKVVEQRRGHLAAAAHSLAPPQEAAQAGLVDSERRGLWAFYHVRPDALEELSGWLR